MTLNNIWVEKYRPKTINEMVLNDEVKTFIGELKAKQEIPHLLLVSSPGRGKTTLAKVIATDVLECQFLYINASDENGIDAIREKVKTFAETKSLFGNHKLIILDEADGLTNQGQQALRGVMEEYASFCRFILTANQVNHISAAIQSRCVRLDVTPPLNDVVQLCARILKNEGVAIEDKTGFVKIVKSRYPDIRRIINTLQRGTVDGVFRCDVADTNDTTWLDELYDIKADQVADIRAFLARNHKRYNCDFGQLYTMLFNWLATATVQNKSQKLVRVADYMYKHTSVLDQEINICSCLIEVLL